MFTYIELTASLQKLLEKTLFGKYASLDSTKRVKTIVL